MNLWLLDWHPIESNRATFLSPFWVVHELCDSCDQVIFLDDCICFKVETYLSKFEGK